MAGQGPAAGETMQLGLIAWMALASASEVDWERQCDAGEWAACHNLGNGARDGDPPNRVRAAVFFGKGCEGGLGPSCLNLGLLHAGGVSGGPDLDAATPAFAAGCALDSAEACFNYGTMLSKTDEEAGERVLAKAERLFQSACAAGDSRSCGHGALAREVAFGKAQTEGLPELHAACAAPDPDACYNLGVAYERGDGVPADAARAADLYQTACTADIAPGCNNLANALMDGEGDAADRARARTLFDKACGLGSGTGCYNLGTLLSGAEATAAFERACALKLPQACERLGN